MSGGSGRFAGVGPPARLRENIASLSVLQVVNYAAPLATVPYLLRVLGPTQFGLLSFAQALILYFDLVVDYGFSLGATRAVASCRHDSEALARTFWRTTLAKLALLLAAGAVLAVLILTVPLLRETPWLYAAAFLNVAGLVACPVWLFQGLEQMRILTAAQSAARLLTIPALVLLVRSPEHTLRAATIQGAVPLAAGVLLFPALLARVPGRPRLALLREIPAALREGWSLFLAHAALALHTATTTVVLGLVAGHAQVGYYSAADKVIRAVTSALGPIAQALYPHLNNLKTRSVDLTLGLMRRSFGWILAAAAAASLVTFLLSGWLGPLVWGEDFGPSVAILRCLSPLPLLLALVNLIGAQTMLVFGMDGLLARVLGWCALVNVPVAAALSYALGALGAAAGVVVVAAVMVLCLAWNLRQEAPSWRLLGNRG